MEDDGTSSDALASTGADSVLLADAEDATGERVPVLLKPMLSVETGGIQWVPEPYNPDTDIHKLLHQLRLWYPPMLNDVFRNNIWDAAISQAVQRFRFAHGRGPVVLDIGCGTGLLAMMAARAGAAHVIAVDSFPGLGHVTGEIVEANGLTEKITVRQCKGSELENLSDLIGAERCDMVVSELLDHTFVGEGMVPALCDASRRLLTPEAVSVPTFGSVWVALIAAGVLDRYRVPIMADEVCAGAYTALVPHGLLPLRLAEIPGGFEYRSEKVECLKLNLTPSRLIEVDAAQENCLPVTVSRAGSIDAIAMWWELEVDGANASDADGKAYSSSVEAERKQGLQDHWKQCVSVLPIPIEASAGSTLHVVARFDGVTTLALDLVKHDVSGPRLTQPTSRLWSPGRAFAATCPMRANTYATVFAPGNPAAVSGKNVLDISDGSFAGIEAALRGAATVVCLEDRPQSRALLTERLKQNDCSNAVIWAGAAQGEPWNTDWGPIDVLVGDGYYERLAAVPLWQPLNFWYLRTAVNAILSDNAVVVPGRVRIMAAAVQFQEEAYAQAHAPVGSPSEFDHSVYQQHRDMTKGARVSARLFDPIDLWQHDHTLLTEPVCCATLDLCDAIDWEHELAPQHCQVTGSVCCKGWVEAVVVWAEYDVSLPDGESRVGFTDYTTERRCPDATQQSVLWVHPRKKVDPEARAALMVDCIVDVAQGDMSFDYQIQDKQSSSTGKT
eukprot:m.155363 g.155363  ORF g.155363 m.155363 type:complete len:728 (-) comp14405_c0_seq1:2600-4783(-)